MSREKPEGWAPERISRRKALKRVAAGTAVAWSAPVLTSLSTPAFAQRYPPCADCVFFDVCGETVPVCPSGTACLCELTVEDECFCSSPNFFCGSTARCTSSSQCPQGWGCLGQGCCDTGSICVPPCAEPASVQGDGPTRVR
jgi:hypothetical protein